MSNKLNTVMLAAMASTLPLPAQAATHFTGEQKQITADSNGASNLASSVTITASENVALKVANDGSSSSEVVILGCHTKSEGTAYGASTGGGSMVEHTYSSGCDGSTLDQSNFSGLGS
jgi:hypothetical protein